jgi:AAA domain
VTKPSEVPFASGTGGDARDIPFAEGVTIPPPLTREEQELLVRAARRALDEVDPVPSDAPAEPFTGLSHDEVLKLTFEEERQLVEELVEAGVLGVIAGIPETHKSWLAHAIAVGVARGEGEILGQRVATQGAVGYFWQDDSRRNEAERIQTLERVRANPAGLPLRWFLNDGLQLPRDLGRLRATVDEHKLILVVVDSFYNVAVGDLKDRDAGEIVAALKAQVCDPTGCTVLIVDHMPWATDSNRQRLRTYGDVFKGAAARFGIYIDAERKKLYVEARGNNIRGFKRTPAHWDADALELKLIDVEKVDEEELDGRVREYVNEHPGAVTKKVEDGVEGGRESIRKSLERLASNEVVAEGPGERKNGHYWYPANHPALQPPGDLLATAGDMSPGPSQGQLSPESPAPRRGGDSAGDNKNGGVEDVF